MLGGDGQILKSLQLFVKIVNFTALNIAVYCIDVLM